ncbi:GFA family protein [Microbulbifer pacificus]|uniref:GFA family protein n=1 Tax=Microbulbifer pacificus TaxID=407164 RepID=A0AAU0MZT0_9GAMM|nr:GFA family protein [Microbulbifer pacificus]WOX04939.1 GFA family protein [Microbulbifer pacificus]
MNQELKAAKGQCLCGSVKFEIDGEISSFHICYCSRCRHSTGSAHASNMFTKPESVSWLSGEEFIQRFELESAKSWAKQFCKVCGSGVPYLNRSGTFLVVPAGSLDDNINIKPDDRIFCEDRSAWVEGIQNSPEFPALPDKF